jgi:hypothetical protein
MHRKLLSEDLKGGDGMGQVGTDGRVINLKLMWFKDWCGIAWFGLGTSGGHL